MDVEVIIIKAGQFHQYYNSEVVELLPDRL